MPPTQTKLPLCCARLQSRLTMDKTNLGRLAQKAAVADQRNRDISRLRVKIEEAKAVIKADEAAIVDHDAEHAAECDGSACRQSHFELRA